MSKWIAMFDRLGLDMSYEDMRALWEASPQHMADLVRKKGGCLYKTPRERDLIV